MGCWGGVWSLGLGAPFPDDQIITGALHLNAQPRIDQRLGLSTKAKAGADPDANAAVEVTDGFNSLSDTDDDEAKIVSSMSSCSSGEKSGNVGGITLPSYSFPNKTTAGPKRPPLGNLTDNICPMSAAATTTRARARACTCPRAARLTHLCRTDGAPRSTGPTTTRNSRLEQEQGRARRRRRHPPARRRRDRHRCCRCQYYPELNRCRNYR